MNRIRTIRESQKRTIMTSRVLRNFFLLLAALAVLLSPAVAQGRGQGNAHKQKDKNRMDQDRGDQGQDQDRDEGNHKTGKHRVGVQTTVPVFGPRDRDLIGGYYQNQYSNLPPGLAKRGGNLPPGLERQLQRNGTLPPGLQKLLELPSRIWWEAYVRGGVTCSHERLSSR
jgi:hypothetical protein